MKQIKKYSELNNALRRKTFYVGLIRKYEHKERNSLNDIEIKMIANANKNIDELDRIIHKYDNDICDIILDFQNNYLSVSNKKLSKYANTKTDKSELELLYLYILLELLNTDKDSFLNNASLVFLGLLTENDIIDLLLLNGIDLNNCNTKQIKTIL